MSLPSMGMWKHYHCPKRIHSYRNFCGRRYTETRRPRLVGRRGRLFGWNFTPLSSFHRRELSNSSIGPNWFPWNSSMRCLTSSLSSNSLLIWLRQHTIVLLVQRQSVTYFVQVLGAPTSTFSWVTVFNQRPLHRPFSAYEFGLDECELISWFSIWSMEFLTGLQLHLRLSVTVYATDPHAIWYYSLMAQSNSDTQRVFWSIEERRGRDFHMRMHVRRGPARVRRTMACSL